MANIVTFNDLTFSYEEENIESINSEEQVHVYSNVIILKSNFDSKFKVGDKIQQVSICSQISFEYEDGTNY